MCARVLTRRDPRREAWRCLSELDDDLTASYVVQLLPDDATVTVLGWPEVAARALPPRGDVVALVVDALGEGGQLVRRLGRLDVDATEVGEAGTAAAVLASDVVLLEAVASGPDGFLAIPGSRAAAAVARHAGVAVWLVAAAGRALPAPLWHALVAGWAVPGTRSMPRSRSSPSTSSTWCSDRTGRRRARTWRCGQTRRRLRSSWRAGRAGGRRWRRSTCHVVTRSG
jgi:hypothetical protein